MGWSYVGDDPKGLIEFLRHLPREARMGEPAQDQRFNPYHSKSTGQFTGKGGGGGAAGPRAGGAGGTLSPEEAVMALKAGKYAKVNPGSMKSLVAEMSGTEPMNLSHLDVVGSANKNLFTKHIRDIPRSQMPQLPNSVGGLKAFTDGLANKGVKARLRATDPRELVATQSELNSQKVAKLATIMYQKGWAPDGVMIASREGAILDGHHRWAGASVAQAMGKKIDMNVLWVDMGIDDLLKFADAYSGQKMGMAAGLGTS